MSRSSESRRVPHTDRPDDALGVSNARLHALVNAIPDMMFVLSRDGTYLDFKASTEMEPLVPPGQFLGKKVTDVLPADLAHQSMQIIERALESGAPQVFEYDLPMNNVSRSYEARVVVSGRDEVVAVVRDITERKRSEELLRQGRADLARAQKIAGLGSWNWDITTDTVAWSEELYNICGIEPGGFGATYESSLALVHPDDRDRVQATIAKSLGDHRPYVFDLRIIRPDGGVRTTITRGEVIVDQEGRTIRMTGTALDITDRKLAEERLHEQYEQLRVIYHLSDALGRAQAVEEIYEEALKGLQLAMKVEKASILLFDQDGLMRFKAWRGLSEGYRKSVDGHSPWRPDEKDPRPILISDVEKDSSLEHLKPVIVGEGIRAMAFIPLEYQGRLMGKFMVYYGEPHHFTEEEVRLTQTITSHVAFAIDRKRAEEELRRSEERFQLAARATNDVIWDLDLASDRLTWGDGFQAMFGDDPRHTEHTFDSWLERVHPEDRDRVVSTHQATLEREREFWSGEYRFRRADGSYADVYDRLYLIRDAAGTPARLVGALMDVSDRKRAEEALKESEARLRLALDAAHMGSWNWDIRANTAVYSNELGPMFGLPPGSSLQTLETFLEVVHADDRQRVASAVTAALEGKADYGIEYRVVWSDGSLHWVWSQGQVFYDEDGRAIRMAGIVTDITERKQAEQARLHLLGRIVAAQEDERRRVARELHDRMGQDLTVLMLGLESLKDARRAPSGGWEKAVHELKLLTGHIMDEVHGLAWELRPMVLDHLGLMTALHRYTREWSEHCGILVELQSVGLDSRRLPPQIEMTVYRVIQEALTNVLKHAEARRVSIVLRGSSDNILAIIEDDGRGFDAEATMAADPQKRLGLLGMQERLALVGGRLDVESTPGAGTTVFARLPIGN